MSDYIKGTLQMEVYFRVTPSKATAVCRNCRFCRDDPSNRRREYCEITGEVLPFADLCIDSRCPIDFGEEDI